MSMQTEAVNTSELSVSTKLLCATSKKTVIFWVQNVITRVWDLSVSNIPLFQIYSMTVRLSAMFEEHMKTVIYNWKCAERQKVLGKLCSSRMKRKPARLTSSSTQNASTSQPSAGTSAVSSRSHRTGLYNLSSRHQRIQFKSLQTLSLRFTFTAQ